MPFRREYHPDDVATAFAMLDNATYADALYVAVARRLGCSLMTSDSGMAECVRIVGVDVIRTASV